MIAVKNVIEINAFLVISKIISSKISTVYKNVLSSISYKNH